MNTATLQTFATFLPVFPGFYQTRFDESDSWLECELNDERCFREHYPEWKDIPFDFICKNLYDVVSFSDSFQAVAKSCAKNFPRLLPDIVKRAEFEKINSPKEYNFQTDSINCKMEIDLVLLHELLDENKMELAEYLEKRYTSCSGFISSYPNDIEGWQDETNDFTELDGHYLGALLEFACELEHGEQTDNELYEVANVYEVFSNNVEIDYQKMIDLYEFEKA